MSQIDVNENKEKALNLVRAISAYFKENPESIIGLIYDIAEDLLKVVERDRDLREELGIPIGQTRLLSRLLWRNDHKNVIQRTIATPEGLANIIEALSELATAYDLIKSDKAEISDINNLVEKAVEALMRIIEDIIVTASYCDP